MNANRDTAQAARPGRYPPGTAPVGYPPHDPLAHPPYAPLAHPPHLRPRPPMPRAPGWFPVAVLAVGAVAALLATLNRPGIGLVVTGAAAVLTALAALMARPAVAEDGSEESAGPPEHTGVGGADSTAEAEEHEAAADAGETAEAATARESPASDAATPEAPGDADGGEDTEARKAAHPEDSQTTCETVAPQQGDGTDTPREASESGAAAENARAHPPHHPQGPGGAPWPPGPGDGPHRSGAYGTGWGHHPWPQYPQRHPHWTGPASGAPAPALQPVVPAPEPEPERYSRAWSAVFGVLATALLATAAVRDAGWVLVWTLTGAFLLASLAFAVRNPAFRRGPAGVLSGSLALLRHLPASPRLLFDSLRSGRARGLVGPAVLTAVVTVLLLVVFGVLFAFADPVFASYLTRPFQNLDIATVILRLLGAALAVLFTASAVLAARRRPEPGYRHHGPVPTASSGPNWPTWVWSIPLGSLIALFTAFVAVQGAVMFGGDDYVQSVTGLIYAEYARQGFFQLVLVSFLVLGVIALATALVPARGRAVRTTRNVLLGLLCLLTLVILASAMMRLQLYIDVFGLTRMRASAEAWILWSGAVFVLVAVAGLVNTLGRSTAWFPRAAVALSAVALVVFAYGNPDLRIAESHQDLDLATVDTWYLRSLSADAVPGLMALEGDDRDCAVLELRERLEDPDREGLASWNLSRERGRQRLAELGAVGSADQLEAACFDRYLD